MFNPTSLEMCTQFYFLLLFLCLTVLMYPCVVFISLLSAYQFLDIIFAAQTVAVVPFLNGNV